jgi:hypothetical protein
MESPGEVTMKKYDEEPEHPDETMMTTTDGELNAEKHQEKTTTDEPEQPTRTPDKLLQNSPIHPASSYVQASGRRARTYSGEAELPGIIGSHLDHPRYGENPLCLNLEVSNDDVASQATTEKYDEERNAESIRTTNDGEQHHERIKMKNDGELKAEKHHRLTFAGGTRVPGASNLTRLKKEVIRASTLWFTSARCYEDELRDGIR